MPTQNHIGEFYPWPYTNIPSTHWPQFPNIPLYPTLVPQRVEDHVEEQEPNLDLYPRLDDLDRLALEVAAEVRRAIAKHGLMHSPHEGISVIREEVDELWEHVRADTGRSPEARKEAIQIAAMGLKYAMTLCERPIDRD